MMDATKKIEAERLSNIAAELPKLSTVIRYYDDFEDKFNSIRDPEDSDCWDITYDGETCRLVFSGIPVPLKKIIKHIAVDVFSRMDASGAEKICRGLINNCTKRHHIVSALTVSPEEYRRLWINEISASEPWSYCRDIRVMLHSLCNQSIAGWKPELRAYVSLLESPRRDIYKTVRTGECFLPLEHQSLIIEHLDTLAARVLKDKSSISTTTLRDSCLLILSHQYGVRPGQSARVKYIDVRSYESGAVHLSLPLLKQRGAETMRKITRKIKIEWCPIFIEYTKRHHAIISGNAPLDSYFKLAPKQLSAILSNLMDKLTGTRWSPTDLRHTAAQRLADAGTSHIVLSEFMGHSTTLSANVYFDTSQTQAQRINQALGISHIYSTVASVAKTRTIDKDKLLNLPADQQIGGVPHGIPIAGIGGCTIGQSVCTKNPILSCYTCRKFMPLSDPAIHESVVETLRPIVSEFLNASRFNDESPAYTQLKRMFQAALDVSEEIKRGNGKVN